MWPMPAGMADALTKSHVRTVRVEVLVAGSFDREVLLLEGNVQVDGSAKVRRTCDVTISDPTGTLAPLVSADLLWPGRNELRIYRGLVTPAAVRYEVPVGVYGIAVATPRLGRVEISGADRSRRVARARLTTHYVIPFGTNYAVAIKDLIDSRVPGLTYSFAPVSYATPLIVANPGDDPWELAVKMAAAIGHELLFDAAGTCVLRPVVDPATDPVVAKFRDDTTVSTLLDTVRELDDERAYTHAVVVGEAGDDQPAVRGEAFAGDPLDPDFVDVPVFLVSQMIRTEAQADAAAEALILRKAGVEERVQIEAVPNPALDAGDVIDAADADTGTAGPFVAEQIDLPLGAGRMRIAAATRRAT